jgi:glycosyltransferase involved in cell wall biosynthesis
LADVTETPLVSVVVPCYRQAHYLPGALDSALAQSYPAVEIIVVNDGSDDDTEAVTRRYGDRVRYVYRANGGLSAARNTGIAQVRGTYLKFLDADDYLHPDQLAWHMAAMAGRADRVSMTGVRLFRDGHPDQFIDHVPAASALLPDLFRDMDWGGIHGYLFPTALVRAVGGFDESLRFAEDWNFFCRIGLHAPQLMTDPRIGAFYRLRAGSMSTNRVGMITTRAGLIMELHDILRDAGRADWFGIDLLKLEQVTYHGLFLKGVSDRAMLDGLLARIKELQKREGFGHFGWRFRMMARMLGYERAERVRTRIIHLLGKKAPEALDTAAWRDSA